MFAGQLGCEAVNWVLKRLIKEARPTRECGSFLRASTPSANNGGRNARKGIRYAIFPCPICGLLFRIHNPLGLSPVS